MATCPNCNHAIKDTANFCTYCGYALRGAPAQPPSSPTPPPFEATPAPTAAPGQRRPLLALATLFAVAGLALIFLVAPELTAKWTWLWNTWEETTPEYWMAMVGGGISLLLAGMFLLRAITATER
jgi:hypothetical protein